MDRSNHADLLDLAPDAEARARSSAACSTSSCPTRPTPTIRRVDVPDPYYGGPTGFADVFDLIDTACDGLLAHVLEHVGDRGERRGSRRTGPASDARDVGGGTRKRAGRDGPGRRRRRGPGAGCAGPGQPPDRRRGHQRRMAGRVGRRHHRHDQDRSRRHPRPLRLGGRRAAEAGRHRHRSGPRRPGGERCRPDLTRRDLARSAARRRRPDDRSALHRAGLDRAGPPRR